MGTKMKENLQHESADGGSCMGGGCPQNKCVGNVGGSEIMRTFETKIQELKTSVLTEVARLTWEDRTQTGILDIPEKIIPGPESSLRCCIYKERAIIGSRVKMAMGGDKTNPCVV